MTSTPQRKQWRVQNCEGDGAEDNVSALSSFIVNAHNKLLLCLLHGKRRLTEKKLSGANRGRPPSYYAPLESATERKPQSKLNLFSLKT